MSGSVPVTSRENGAVHETVTDVALLEVFRSTIDDRIPDRKENSIMGGGGGGGEWGMLGYLDKHVTLCLYDSG